MTWYYWNMIIGVDIGGTKTLVGSFVGHDIVREDRFATAKDSEVFLSDLIPLIKAHAGHHKLEAISLAAPGIIDHHRGSIVRCGNLPWKDIGIRSVLHKHFDCPVYIENDANLAGLAEAHAIHPIPQLCLYLTFSTGIGSGIVVNGKLIPALSGSEAGHMMLRRDGGYVLWEHAASGKSLVERTGKKAAQIHDEATWTDVAERAASGLLALIPVLQPSVIVIGGSIGAHFDRRWSDMMVKLLHQHMPPYISMPPILQAQYPEEAFLYGCRIYAQQQLDD